MVLLGPKMVLICLFPLLSAMATVATYLNDAGPNVRPVMELQSLLQGSEDGHIRVKKASLPTPIDQLVNDAQSAKEYEFSPACKLVANPADEAIAIAILPKECSEKPSLKMILDQLLPDVKIASASSYFICPDCYYFESLTFDKGTKAADIKAKSKETIRLMNPSYFEIEEAELEFAFNTNEMDLDLSKIKIEMKGMAQFKGRSMKTRITKDTESIKFSFSMEAASISLRDMFGHFGIKILELSVPEVGFTTSPYSTVRLKDPIILGAFTIDVEEEAAAASTTQLIAKADLQNSRAFQRATIYAIVDKKPGLPPTGAILAAVPENYNMLDQLKKFLTLPKFNKELPMLRKIKRRYLICVCQDEITVIEDESMLELLKPYIKGDDANVVPAGATVKIFVPIKDNMKECSPPVKLPELPDELPINIFLKKRGLDFTYPEKFKADMPSMLKCLDMQIAAEIPYQLFPKKDGLISIKEFTFGIGRNFRVAAALNGPFVLAKGLLNISDIDLLVQNKLDPETEEWEWTFSGSTSVTFKTLTVDVSIERAGGEYTVTGSVESFFLTDLKEITGDNIFFKLIELLGPLKNFGIKDFTIIATMGESKILRVAGQPILFGRNDLHLEAIIYKDEDTTSIVLGILIRQVKLHKLMEDLTGKALIKAAWLADMTAYIMISNTDSEETFSMAEMEEAGVEKGILIKADFSLPEECHGDSLCEFMAQKFGRDVVISIEGQIQKNDGSWFFKLSAGIAGAYEIVPGKLTLKGVGFSITVDGMDSNIEIACEMDYENKEANIDTLTFQGAISLGLSGELSLAFTMVGMWLQPFGFQYLGFGNLNLGIGYQIGAPLPSFEFGGELWLGKIETGENATNDHLFKVACYFGMDPGDPTNNYIYTSINKLTVNSIMEAFKIETDMPQVVADTGFPEGLIVSFTSNPDGVEIEALDIKVEFGFYLKGTINILGFTLTSEIIISDDVIQVDVAMSPLQLAGGLLTVYKSKEDSENGPKCFVKIDEEAVIVQIEGYMYILGSYAEVVIDVSDTGFKFNVTIMLYNIVTANVYVEAAYGSMQTAAFKFRANLAVSFKRISAEIKKFLDQVAKDAQKAFDRAQAALDRAKKKIDAAKGRVDGWKGELSAFRQRNNRRIEELEKQKQAMNEDCKKNCGEVCVPFLDWNPQCFKLWWWWCGCPAWNSCKWKAPNLLCIAGCETKKFFNKVGASIEQFGLKVVNAFSHIGDVVLDIGKGVLDIGNKCLDFSKAIVASVGALVQIGLQIAKEAVTVLLEKLLEIRKLVLSGSFDADLNACVGMECDMTFLGLEVKANTSICINLNFFKALSSKTTEKKYPGVNKMYTDLEKKEGDYEELNKTESDMDDQVKKGEEEVDTEIRKPSKRSEIPNLRDAMPSGYNPFPEWVMKRSDIMDIFRQQAPWVLANTIHKDLVFSYPVEDTEQPFKRTMEDAKENSPDHCVRLRGAIAKFGELVSAFYQFHSSMNQQKHQIKLYDSHVNNKIKHIENNIGKLGELYNITSQEKEDAYFWHNLMKKGHEEWKMKAHNLLRHQERNTIPSLRSSINYVLMKKKNTRLEDYLDDLEGQAQDANKRSRAEAYAENASKIRRIKKILLKVFDTKEEMPSWMHRDMKTLKADLRSLKAHAKKCRHQ